MTIEEMAARITPADEAAAARALAKWNTVAKPLGSLGLLEDNVTRICAMTSNVGFLPESKCVVAFCADNGVVAENVTQSGQEVTSIVAENFCTGDTSMCKMADIAGAKVVPVDMGMATPVTHSRMRDLRIAAGSKDMLKGPAMTRDEAERGVMSGMKLALELAEGGVDLFATGEMGIGNTTTSSAVASVLLSEPVVTMTGPGAGLSKEGVLHKIDVIERSIALNAPDPHDPIDVLAKVGGFDIAGMVGLDLGCAIAKRPCLIDGFISAVAALVASRICPDVRDYLIASHVSAEPAGMTILDALDLSPMITAGMRLGEGSGAVAAMPLLDMGFAVFNSMSTFDDIQIEAYQPL